jgi:hypothetical protein
MLLNLGKSTVILMPCLVSNDRQGFDPTSVICYI